MKTRLTCEPRSSCRTWIVWLLSLGGAIFGANGAPISSIPQPGVNDASLVFERNIGQFQSDTRFRVRGQGYCLSLNRRGASLLLETRAAAADPKAATAEVRTSLIGARPGVDPEGELALAGEVNILKGKDMKDWIRRISTWAQVRYESIYPGVDLVFHGKNGSLEYDFILEPFANPSLIKWQVEGPRSARLGGSGDLILETEAGVVTQHKPVAYQQVNGIPRIVPAEFVLERVPSPVDSIKNEYQIAFKVGDYDPAEPLIIDPTLDFVSPLGGSADDRAFSVAVDTSGYIYVAGQTASFDFPGLPSDQSGFKGGTDAFVTKLARDGKSTVYTTVLGGSGLEKALKIAVSTNGEVIVAGSTTSSNFPAYKATQEAFGGGERDGFIARLDAAGTNLVFSTYLGGSGPDDIACITLDSDGFIYVGGTTLSTNLPVLRALQAESLGQADAFVGRFDASGAMDYCSYFGGRTGGECILDIAIDKNQNTCLVGYTSSQDFPLMKPIQGTLLGGYDVFVAKINPNATALLSSSFFGGTSDDVGRSIAVDPDGNIVLAGDTVSDGFPIVNPVFPHKSGQRDLFVAKMDANLSKVFFSTYLGGSGDEMGAMTVDGPGNLHLAGVTSSRDFPSISAFQPHYGGGACDSFVATLKGDGSSLVFASYLGGSQNDQSASIACDLKGILYIAGSTASTNISMVRPLQSLVRSGAYDAFVASINPWAGTNTVVQAQPVASTRASAGPAPLRKTVVPPSAPNVLQALGAALPLFGKNLAINGMAEAVRSGTPTNAINAVPGWETDGSIMIAAYGKTRLSMLPTNGGMNCFVLTDDAQNGCATQSIDVSPASVFLDTGDARFAAGAMLSGWQERTHSAAVTVKFLDASSNRISESNIGPIPPRERSFFNRMVSRAVSGRVPIGTRKIAVELRLTRDDKQNDSAVADNVYVVLYRPPASLLQVTRSDNQVRLSWPAILGGYVLEASNLLPPTEAWELITNSPVLIDGQNTLNFTVSGPDRYYRLRKP